jgi:hypothetical protein
MQTVETFFTENPTATNCFVALGIVKPTFEEALALLGGTKFQYVKTFTKDGEVTGNDIDDLLAAYNKCADDENFAQQQFEQVPSEANMLAWKGKQKDSQLALLAFHNLLLKKSKEATAPAIEEVKVEEVVAPATEEVKVEEVVAAPAEEVKVEEVVAPATEEVKVEEVVAAPAEEVKVEEVVAPAAEEMKKWKK